LPPVATTLIFAIYAIPLLLALLTLGSLSDRVGRRGILTVGSVALSVSLLMFWAADSFLLLLAARALQGLAAGLLVP
ncbi:MFS transporter, partial [Vibrio parahaemolyticus]